MMAIEAAQMVMFVAHSACGQTRADGITPYHTHPERVASLFAAWKNEGILTLHPVEMVDGLQAAYLHDVVEDTKLTLEDLHELGFSARVVDIVDLLTKKSDGSATAGYYQAIARDDIALSVKCADRCANLETALDLVKAGMEVPRWRRYVEKTTFDVLPMYVSLPLLREQLVRRLRAIEDALDAIDAP